MSVITVYVSETKAVLQPPTDIVFRANQALQTLERYRHRLDEVRSTLSALEVEDLVTLRDMVAVLQRTEMVRRIASEIELDIIELGIQGRLVQLQLLELMAGVEDDRRFLIKDYFHEEASWHLEESLAALDALNSESLLDLARVAIVLHIPDATLDLDVSVTPRGYPPAVAHPSAARVDRRPRRRALRFVAQDHARHHRRPRRGRRGGRRPRPGHQRRPRPPDRKHHPRPLRLTCFRRRSTATVSPRHL